MKTVLVTGGAGFIGSHLVPALLAAGFAVRVLDTLSPQIHGAVPGGLDWLSADGVQFMRGSVTRAGDVARAMAGAWGVIHLASETGTGQSMYEIDRYCEENVKGTAVLMQHLVDCRGGGINRVMLASSRSVYGEGSYVRDGGGSTARVTPPPRSAAQLKARQWEPVCPDTGAPLRAVPSREDDRTAPASIYAATKLMQEDMLRITCGSLGIGYAILRLQNVYGEGQSLKNPYTGLLSVFSTRIRRGLPLTVFEDGLETRDFVHVSDVAGAFVSALRAEAAPDTVINVGSGAATPVIAAARALSRAFSAPERIEVTGQFRLGDIRHNSADISRLKERLGVVPSVALDAGLARFAEWALREPLPEDRLDEANEELQRRKMMG